MTQSKVESSDWMDEEIHWDNEKEFQVEAFNLLSFCGAQKERLQGILQKYMRMHWYHLKRECGLYIRK